MAERRRNLDILADTGAPVGPGAVGQALERTGLTPVAGRKVRTYSQGMRQRLGLAVTLLRRPQLLLLDEPANGLDPAGILEVRTLLRGVAAEGVTGFLSSHLLGEVEQVCDRVAVMDRGRLVEVTGVGELGRCRERVRVAVQPQEEEAAVRLLGRWTVERRGDGVLLVATGSSREVNRLLAAGGVVAAEVTVDRTGLEKHYLSITNGEVGRAPAPR